MSRFGRIYFFQNAEMMYMAVSSTNINFAEESWVSKDLASVLRDLLKTHSNRRKTDLKLFSTSKLCKGVGLSEVLHLWVG